MKFILEYIPLRVIVFILSVLPRGLSLKIGRTFGSLACRVMGSRYQIAKKNIQSALPGTSDEKAYEIVTGCWQNLGQSAAELAFLPSLSKEEYLALYDVKGMEYIKESQAKGKGLILVASHYGPWEFTVHIFPFNHIRMSVVARRIKNPYVDRLVNYYRTLHGNEVILSRNAVRNSIKALKGGKMVVILIDHRVKEGGLQVPFLGKPAYTTALPALLALKYQVPAHFIRCWRENERLKAEILPAMDLKNIPNNKEGIEKTTIKMNAVFEDWIRDKPENWLWIHNRWKT